MSLSRTTLISSRSALEDASRSLSPPACCHFRGRTSSLPPVAAARLRPAASPVSARPSPPVVLPLLTLVSSPCFAAVLCVCLPSLSALLLCSRPCQRKFVTC